VAKQTLLPSANDPCRKSASGLHVWQAMRTDAGYPYLKCARCGAERER
jgi:predicted nucleic acid-binding Zn ribbon protein